MSLTLTHVIDQYIRACGPVGFDEIRREVLTQWGHAYDHEVARALTGLLRAGSAVLYDDGTSFDVGPVASAADTGTAPDLPAAARAVLANWERGDLAAAVRELAASLAAAERKA